MVCFPKRESNRCAGPEEISKKEKPVGISLGNAKWDIEAKNSSDVESGVFLSRMIVKSRITNTIWSKNI